MQVRLPKRRPLRLALLGALVMAFVLVTTGALAAIFPARAAASSSSLEVIDGIVALSHDGTSFTQGRDGDLVQQGDVVRTGTDSHAVLTFFDGSTIEVEPDSELVVQTLQANSSGDILMTILQNVGRSWHVVSRALTPNSKYDVRTPTATATVRGTAFLVSVEPNGRTNVQTTDGVVHTIAGGEEVQVPPGFETSVGPGGTPPDPATPAPPPPAVVRVVVDPTPNAIVVDPNGRAVGLLNGLPVRYIPGSTIQLIDGKLVITIPNPALGRLDTHVQPADPHATAVDVNVQVAVGGAVVGNVIEHRTIDGSGVAKGGVVITTSGTFIIPDDDAKKAPDPHIGRLPPPPGGPTLPFLPGGTPAPTPLVTAGPSFVPRFEFDNRLVAATTPTPAPPSPTPSSTFNGAFQPYATRDAIGSATPAPNSSLTVFATTPPELTTLTLATPTPTPTLTTRLTSPLLLATPTPTPDATLILRTVDPIILLSTPTPTPAPTLLILRTISPIELATPTPTPTLLILRTISPIELVTPTPTPAPTSIILRTISPIQLATPTPTPAPTQIIFRSIAPIITATPTPTIAPIVPTFQVILPTASPTPSPSLILRTIAPIQILPTPTPSPTPAPSLRIGGLNCIALGTC